MEPKSWRNLTDDPNHYAKAFKVFRDLCVETGTLSGWLDDAFSEAVVGKLQVTLDEQEELRVLGVGSGSGKMDFPMLEMLLKHFPRIKNRVVEPNPPMLTQYKAIVQSKAHELQGLNCDWRQQTIQQYKEAGNSTKFHFISAVHSLYYVDESSLMYLYDSLVPGGVMLVIIRSDRCGHACFWHRLQTYKERYIYIDSSHLLSVLDRRGVPYTQHRRAQSIDITQCFDPASEEGRLLLDFLTQTVHFKETTPTDLQVHMMEYLASSDCSEKKDDVVLLNMDLSVIVINRPKVGV